MHSRRTRAGREPATGRRFFLNAERAMTYLNCSRCHLAILEPALTLSTGLCPRCLGREGVHSPMFASPLPYRELVGVGSAESGASSGVEVVAATARGHRAAGWTPSKA